MKMYFYKYKRKNAFSPAGHRHHDLARDQLSQRGAAFFVTRRGCRGRAVRAHVNRTKGLRAR